tara:strand:- start:35 stop:190 length:156 start_codon:yes stop_codon:yes gene_type:complete
MANEFEILWTENIIDDFSKFDELEFEKAGRKMEQVKTKPFFYSKAVKGESQ